MVWNNGGEGDFFDLGPFLAAVPAGASRVTLFPGPCLLLQHGGAGSGQELRRRRYSAASGPGGSAKKNAAAKKRERRHARFFRRQAGARHRLPCSVPYLVYFYLPLALIVILIATYGAAMAAAFFYYRRACSFFSIFRSCSSPFPCRGCSVFFNIEPADLRTRVLAVALALLFLAAAVHGLWRWKNSEMPASGKWIVWFFILLPLFLFF